MKDRSIREMKVDLERHGKEGGFSEALDRYVKRRQFKARKLENGKLEYDTTRCFGCGLCISTCPPGCFSLVEGKVG